MANALRCTTTGRSAPPPRSPTSARLTTLLAAFVLLQTASSHAFPRSSNLEVAPPPSPCPGDQILWSNLCWYVRSEAGGPCGDACFNKFSPKLVSVDAAGALNLEVQKLNGRWHSSEVYLNHSLGHGTYTWVMASSPSALDPNLVASSYLYADDTREFDVEFSAWGGSGAQENAQFVVQPPPLLPEDNQLRYRMDSSRPSTHTLSWSSGTLVFTSHWTHASGAPRTQRFQHSGPSAEWPPGDEAFRLSLWMFEQRAPLTGGSRAQALEAGGARAAARTLSLRCFSFCPAGGGGCVGDLSCGKTR